MAISKTQLEAAFGNLSQNSSTANLSLGLQLMNIEQRYLLEKYFSNETSFSITTIGSQNLTLTSALAINATSATLTSAWVYPSTSVYVTFSDGEVRTVLFTYNSTTISWTNGLIGTQFLLTASLIAGATSATLATAWAYSTGSYLVQFSDGETKTVTLTSGATTMTWSGGLSGAVEDFFNTSVLTTAIGVGGVQTYRLPSDYSKLKTGTLTIGSLKWTPTEVLSREEWDKINVFPYYADIPQKFFIWNNQFNFWPIPSSTGNIITFNYKRRIPDLSLADYTTGTVSVSNGSVAVTGSGTTFIPTTNIGNESRWIQFAQPTGDNLWYQVQSVDSTTGITLYAPYQGINISGGIYTLGQMPILMEDFHDILIWRALIFYFTSVKDSKGQRELYQSLYDQKLELLAEYAGTKTVQVNLSRRPYGGNPNLFPYNNLG